MIKSKIPPIEGSCSAKEIFALQAVGDSMEPEFLNGTLLVIDPEAVYRDGSYVVAKVEEDNYILRQLRIQMESTSEKANSKRYFLQPLNDLYDTVEIKNAEDIIGVVIQQGSRKRNMKKYS